MILEFVLFVITIFLVIKLFQLNKKPPGTPPGTNGLPIIGVLPPKDISFEKFIQLKREQYGDTFWLKMGTENVVFLCKYEDIVAAFSNPALQGRPVTFSLDLMYKFGEKDPKRRDIPMKKVLGILTSEGERWKNFRRFVIRRLRDGGMGRSSSMESIILRETEALIEDFERHTGTPTEIPWSVNGAILNVVWGIIGDRRYDICDKKSQDLFNNLNEMLTISQGYFFIFDRLTWLINITPNFILKYFRKQEFEDRTEKVFDQMHAAVEEHKKTLDEDNPRDLIDSYLIDLKNMDNNDLPNKCDYSSTFSERELIQGIFDLFFAGSETTSSTVKWHIFFMAKFENMQKKVQEEIDNAVPKDRMITFAEKEKLPYLEATINETLRLKSILPFGLFHLSTEDTKIGEYFIPKGTQVLGNLIGCHRDPRYWKKPDDFYPEHFINDDGTFNNRKEGLIAFSTGRRVCLGENLARMDLFLVLAALMQRFTFSVPEGQIMSEEACPKQPFFTIPKSFNVIIKKRR